MSKKRKAKREVALQALIQTLDARFAALEADYKKAVDISDRGEKYLALNAVSAGLIKAEEENKKDIQKAAGEYNGTTLLYGIAGSVLIMFVSLPVIALTGSMTESLVFLSGGVATGVVSTITDSVSTSSAKKRVEKTHGRLSENTNRFETLSSTIKADLDNIVDNEFSMLIRSKELTKLLNTFSGIKNKFRACAEYELQKKLAQEKAPTKNTAKAGPGKENPKPLGR